MANMMTATEFKLEQKWMQLRIADINFVLDTILARAKDAGSDAVYQLIDPEKIGLMGHSLGGESSAQVARERNDIDAVINLDADLAGEYLDFVDGKDVMNDKVYPVPILTILADDFGAVDCRHSGREHGRCRQACHRHRPERVRSPSYGYGSYERDRSAACLAVSRVND